MDMIIELIISMQKAFLLLFLTYSFSALGQEASVWQSPAARENLYQSRHQEISRNADFDELNTTLIESIKNYSPEPNSRRVNGITREQADKLLKELKAENFFISAEERYDLKQNLGFCFGRSIYLHLMLLKYGVNKDSIKKVFAIGSMESGLPRISWQFHVATIVKDQNSNDWWALDSNFEMPLLLDDWVYQMKRRSQDKTYRIFRAPLVDKSKSLRFFITDPQKIGPSGWEYNIRAGGLFDGFYNNYFQDMFKVLKNKNISENDKFNYSLASCRGMFR